MLRVLRTWGGLSAAAPLAYLVGGMGDIGAVVGLVGSGARVFV